METNEQNIHDISLVVIRCICGVLAAAALVILALSISKSQHRKYAAENAYSNSVTITSYK